MPDFPELGWIDQRFWYVLLAVAIAVFAYLMLAVKFAPQRTEPVSTVVKVEPKNIPLSVENPAGYSGNVTLDIDLSNPFAIFDGFGSSVMLIAVISVVAMAVRWLAYEN